MVLGSFGDNLHNIIGCHYDSFIYFNNLAQLKETRKINVRNHDFMSTFQHIASQ
jgi:hypothetical protein